MSIPLLLLIIFFFFFFFFFHESHSCPPPTHFDCPDDVYNGTLHPPFTSTAFDDDDDDDCMLYCVLTCDNSRTMISCRESPIHYPVLHIHPKSDGKLVVEYPHFPSPDQNYKSHYSPCQSYAFFNGTFPQLSSLKILGGNDTYLGCPYPPQLQLGHHELLKIKSQTCYDSNSIVYGPFELPPNHIPLHCIHFQTFPRYDKELPAVPPKPSNYADTPTATTASISKPKLIPLSVALALSGLANLIILIIYWRQSNKKPGSSRITLLNHTKSDLEEGSINNGVTLFSYAQLQQVTNNFDPARELGEGSFGVVYYGKLEDGREVAVKRMYEKNYKQVEQFMNEINILAQLRHPNLVTLYGSTTRDSRQLLLVYEYIPNGTVADHLHGDRSKSSLLLWSTRMKIAIETATALSYLHFKEIIHRDIKTYNILLDRNFCTKVADFGLSRLFPAEVTHVSTAPQGTPGYLDPEYHQCYHLTSKSDVYSFGVVLIELISSLPAIDMGRQRHEVNLSNYAMNKIQSSAFSELVDPNLGFETNFKVRRMTTLVAELAFQCLQHDRELRPTMAEVMEGLKRIESVDYDELEAVETGM